MGMTTLEHINLYFGGEWETVVEFAKDFREEHSGNEHGALIELLVFLRSMNTANEKSKEKGLL